MAHDWVEIDGQVLIDARARKGLSREALGAIVGVVAKTVERYEKESRVPRALLQRFADALDLDVQEVPAQSVVVTSAGHDDREIAALREELAEVRGMVAKLLAHREESPPVAAPRPARAAQRRRA